MGRDILFQVTKGNLILLFFTRNKFNNRDHGSSLLVQRTYFRRRDFRFETVLMFTK